MSYLVLSYLVWLSRLPSHKIWSKTHVTNQIYGTQCHRSPCLSRKLWHSQNSGTYNNNKNNKTRWMKLRTKTPRRRRQQPQRTEDKGHNHHNSTNNNGKGNTNTNIDSDNNDNNNNNKSGRNGHCSTAWYRPLDRTTQTCSLVRGRETERATQQHTSQVPSNSVHCNWSTNYRTCADSVRLVVNKQKLSQVAADHSSVVGWKLREAEDKIGTASTTVTDFERNLEYRCWAKQQQREACLGKDTHATIATNHRIYNNNDRRTGQCWNATMRGRTQTGNQHRYSG